MLRASRFCGIWDELRGGSLLHCSPDYSDRGLGKVVERIRSGLHRGFHGWAIWIWETALLRRMPLVLCDSKCNHTYRAGKKTLTASFGVIKFNFDLMGIFLVAIDQHQRQLPVGRKQRVGS